MKKLFLLLLTITSYADDLDLGDDFVAGEVVKAADFNTKFSLIEGQEAELTNSYFVGTWACEGPSQNGHNDNATLSSDNFFNDDEFGSGNVTFSLNENGYLQFSNNSIIYTDQTSGALKFYSGYIWNNEGLGRVEVRKVSSTRFYWIDEGGPSLSCRKT